MASATADNPFYITEILDAIVQRIPPPRDTADNLFRALIFDRVALVVSSIITLSIVSQVIVLYDDWDGHWLVKSVPVPSVLISHNYTVFTC